MDNQMERVNISETLLNVFNYAFIEAAPYSFFIPTREKYVAVNLPKKIYHCQNCQKEIEVSYNQAGVVYFSKERFEKQRKMYEKRGLEFPDKKDLAAEQPFIYHEEGYCDGCASESLADGGAGQRSYYLCLQLHRQDEAVLVKARTVMENRVKTWVASITESAQLAQYDLSDYTALKDLVCAIILADISELELCLSDYRKAVQDWTDETSALLLDIPEKWECYAARPTTIYESMSDELYHEYTVVFPVPGTVDQDFYIKRKMDKMRVAMFLKQVRIQTAEELIMEAGFVDTWVDLFIDHMMTLKK